jgi:hypothetical protein
MDSLKLQWQFENQKTICYNVKEIRISDAEDPDLVVAQPIWEWQKTEAGKYVMENSNPKPSWIRSYDYTYYSNVYIIRAYFTPKQLTYYKLRFE